MKISRVDRLYLELFEAGGVSPEHFGHRDHVRLAWAYLRTLAVPDALGRIGDALRGLATAAGRPDRYHETITWAWAFVIHERIASDPDVESFARFASANPDLLDRDSDLLEHYYTPATLSSPTARRTFVMPDRHRVRASWRRRSTGP